MRLATENQELAAKAAGESNEAGFTACISMDCATLSVTDRFCFGTRELAIHTFVQPGDSWPLVAQRVGLTVKELQAANPDSVRANGWLIVGESLFIPWAPDWEEKYYIVQRGDGWISVSEKFGLPIEFLQGANPKAQRANNSLIVGERLLIPALLPTPTGAPVEVSTETSTGTSTETSAVAPAEILSPTATPTPVLDLLAILSNEGEPAPFFIPRISLPLPTRVTLPPCPDVPNDLGQTLTALFRIPTFNRNAQLSSFLSDCGAEFRMLVNADLTSDRVDDAVLVFTNANGRRTGTDSTQSRGENSAGQQELVILDGGQAHTLSYAIAAAGKVELLATQDINADGLTDVVWTDTVCGSNTCFVTVHVRSWDGVAWRDWTKGTITMASANVSLTTSSKPGRPKEIRRERRTRTLESAWSTACTHCHLDKHGRRSLYLGQRKTGAKPVSLPHGDRCQPCHGRGTLS